MSKYSFDLIFFFSFFLCSLTSYQLVAPARRTRKPGPKKSKLNRNITESEEEESSDTGSVTRCICGEARKYFYPGLSKKKKKTGRGVEGR